MANVTGPADSSIAADVLPKRPNPVWLFVRTQPLGFAGLLVILTYVISALGAAWIAPYDPEAIDFAAMLSAPDAEHLLGTDQFGRDVFSRIVYGARTALAVGILSSLIGCTLGALIGAASGFWGGRIDTLIQRLVDIMLSFPIIVLAMVVVAVLGRRPLFGVDMNLVAAISLPIIPKMARSPAPRPCRWCRCRSLMPPAPPASAMHASFLRHIVPNIVAPYLIMTTATSPRRSCQAAVLPRARRHRADAGMGLMLSGASADFYRSGPVDDPVPGLAITLAVFAFNMFGSLRDWLDPKMRDDAAGIFQAAIPADVGAAA
jgi:peptide/nickel transport system permease protein